MSDWKIQILISLSTDNNIHSVLGSRILRGAEANTKKIFGTGAGSRAFLERAEAGEPFLEGAKSREPVNTAYII